MKSTDIYITASIIVTAIGSLLYPHGSVNNTTGEFPIDEDIVVEEYLQKPLLELRKELYPICSCESAGVPNINPIDYHYETDGKTPLIGKVNPLDRGMCQINIPSHKDTASNMGLDILHNIDDYIYYSNWLFEQQGYTPWRYSSHCWSVALK